MHNKTAGYTISEEYRCLEDLQVTGFLENGQMVRLDYCGMERCKPGYSFGPYIRQNYVLHIILDGEGSLQREDKVFHVHKDQAFLLRPGIETVYQADRENPWVYAWIGFHGHLCERLVSSMGFSEDNDVIDVADAGALVRYIDQMLDNTELSFAATLKRSAYLHLLAADIIEYANVPSDNSFSEDAYVDLAVEEITSNYEHPVKISDIAGKIGINRSYLSIIFKKRMGVSPQQYLIDIRLDKAAELLTRTNMAVRMVASQVGYTDPLTFSKAFRQRFGESPSIYRNHIPEVLKGTQKGTYEGSKL